MKFSHIFGIAGLASVLVLSGCSFGSSDQDNQNNDAANDTNSGASQSVTVTPSDSSSAGTDTIALSEVSNHKSADDCWMAVDGKVYDVTDFIANHPGGNVITQGCGKDASRLFDSEHGPHVEEARAQLPPFEIGTLE